MSDAAVEYTLIRSRRRTLGIEIRDGVLIVRAPLRTSKREIDRFLREHEEWIRKHLKKAVMQKEKAATEGKLTDEEIRALAKQAALLIPERVKYYAPLIGVSYGRITIRCQKTRWGSCSSKGNLNFNCLLMLTPPEVIDSVVVHELCHRLEMNHSAAFYDYVFRVFPDYKKWNRWLKENGPVLMDRVSF